MGEWKKTTLSYVAEIIGGFAFKGEHFSDDGDSTVIKIKDIQAPTINIDGATKVFMENYSKDKLEKFLLKRGDFALAMTGATIGKLGKLNSDKQAYINQRVAKIDPHGDVSKEFVYYCMSGDDFQVFIQNNIDSHSAQENISATSIGRYPIDLPCLPEQKAIAEVLCSLDDKIDLLHRQNKTLESVAETLFRQWFIEEAQDDWQIKRVEEVARTNISTMKVDYPHETINYLDTGSITEGKIDSLQPYNLKDAPSRAKRLVRHNDIIISTVRPNHKHYGFIKNPAHDLVVSTGFCVVTCTQIDPHYMYLFLTSEEMTEKLSIIAEASTSTYPSLKPSDIESIEFQMPPPDLLKKFGDIASDNWSKIENNYKQIEFLEKTRDELLPKLMSGEVRVQYQEAL